MMKILHLISDGGNPLYHNLVNALTKYCTHQAVFFPYRKGQRNDISSLSCESIKVHKAPILNIWTRVFYYFKLYKQYKEIRRNFNIADYQCIHAHTLFSDGGVAYWLKKKYNIPYIVAVRRTDIEVFLKYKPWLKRFAISILKNAHQVISISPSISEEIKLKLGISNVKYIPNGIDEQFFEKKTIVKNISEDKIRLLFVGQFYKLKNIPSIIKFVNDNPQYSLKIAGGAGDSENDVLNLINEYNIEYVGFIKDKQSIIKLYQEADIFVMPSKPETFGLVYIEAISQGVPILYAKGTGIDGVFSEGKVGYGIYPNDHKGWNIALQKIVDDYIPISKRCISAATHFKWNIIIDTYIDMYENT